MTNFTYPNMIILGSTGSVGEQALDVAEKLNINVIALSANKNAKRAEEQARRMGVLACAMNDEDAARDLRKRLTDTNIKVYSGADGICEMISEVQPKNENGTTVVNSILGEAGLRPTLATLRSDKKLALANKESLVVGGEIVTKLAEDNKKEILPVDSEHCAIFQCLRSGNKKEIKRIILTASGGPFFGYDNDALENITLKDALAHPTWKMGAKITIDSATLMNKGFEVIEAVHLFGVSPKNIQVTVHRESIIHSAVEYIDNSVIAQMSIPDMRHCVEYAMTHPHRCPSATNELDLFKVGKLTFAEPDTNAFPLLALAISCIERGGALPAILNAANEEAVAAFLSEKIKFTDIYRVVSRCIDRMEYVKDIHMLDDIFASCTDARMLAQALISEYKY